MYRLDYGDSDFHVDFLPIAAGISSLASLRSRATLVAIEDSEVLVASLRDILNSKRLAGRSKDLAVIDVLEKTIAEIDAQDEAWARSCTPAHGNRGGGTRNDPRTAPAADEQAH